MIAYRAILDVPRELVSQLAGLLRAERKRRGTRRGSRALSCRRQALLGLVWFRKNEEMTVLAAGFGIGRATAYRYRDQIVTVLSEQAPDLHEALQQVTDQGRSQVILDGKVLSHRPLRRDHHQHQGKDDPFLVLGAGIGRRSSTARHLQRPRGEQGEGAGQQAEGRDRRDRGNTSAAVTETTETSAPSCVSDRPHSASRFGNVATTTGRSTKSGSIKAKAVPNTARAVDSSSMGSPTRRGRRERPSRGLSMIDLCRGWAVSGGATDRRTQPAPVDCVSRRHAAVCPGTP